MNYSNSRHCFSSYSIMNVSNHFKLKGHRKLFRVWKKLNREDCTLVLIGKEVKKGICLLFPETEKIPVGSTVDLEIPAFKDLKPIHLEETLKWSKKEDSHFVGGIELNGSLYEHEWIKLRDHFKLTPLQGEKPVHTCWVAYYPT